MMLEKNVIKKDCLNKIRKEWLAVEDTFPTFPTKISDETKLQNEQYVKTISGNFKKQFNSFTYSPFGRKKWKQKMVGMLSDVLNTETIIGIHHSMDEQGLNNFQEELKDFLRHVRVFAPELGLDGIGQATRNYIVYAMFCEINQVEIKFNRAAFGYSMLYPFTDNYIDSAEYSNEEKKVFNKLIRDKINGKDVHPESVHNKKTCELLEAIESEYPREDDPTIYLLLLMMLDAQEESMLQQKRGIPLTTEERLDITLSKGGISVLIDRFFVRKEITEEDLFFYFGFGFFLQLADDLQDIKEDNIQGNQTILTDDSSCEQKEKIVNKILHYVHGIMEYYRAENHMFKEFVLSNCYQLIYSSVVGSKEFFSKEYLEKLEMYLPISHTFLEYMKSNQIENMERRIQNNYMERLDAMISK